MPKKKRKKKYVKWIILFLLLLLFLCGAGAYFIYNFRSNLLPSVVININEAAPDKEAFFTEYVWGTTCETDLSAIDTGKLGKTSVEFSWLFYHGTSTLTVRDISAPTAEVKSLTLELGTMPEAEDFLTDIQDETAVSVRYAMAPDVMLEGEQTVGILLEDEAGNATVLTAFLTLYDPTHVPVIEGVSNKKVFVGDTISYRTGVRVVAELDDSPTLEIDNSAVDLDRAGVYTVNYKATDAFGRVGTASIQVTVEEKPLNYDDMLRRDAMIEAVLEQIITPDMTDIEKAFAIFRWVRLSIPWKNYRTKHDEVYDALVGLEGNPGDCYIHGIICKLMLDRVGILNTMIEKNDATGMHFWLLVCFEGEWYNMDPSPIYIHQYVAFLATDDQLKEYAAKYRPHLYDMENSLLPKTPVSTPVKVTYMNGDYILEYGEFTADYTYLFGQ